MSVLYFGPEPVALAERLALDLDRQCKKADPFVPERIVVPNRNLGKWLRLWLARRNGVVVNLRFYYLENALFEMLRALDPRAYARLAGSFSGTGQAGSLPFEPEFLDADHYRLLVLSVLLGDDSHEFAPFQRYLEGEGAVRSRRAQRRAWQLADRLASLIRDYEYHRQDALIQPWIKKQLTLQDQGEFLASLERSQRAIFLRIIEEKIGKRALLNQIAGRNLKTLPQYAMELADYFGAGGAAAQAQESHRTWRLFGITSISALHVDTLRWLGGHFDIHCYYLNPLTARLPQSPCAADLAALAENMRAPGAATEEGALAPWFRAGAESLGIIARLLEQSPKKPGAAAYDSILLSATQTASSREKARKKRAQDETVLARVHKHLFNEPIPSQQLQQDVSLQIVGCPGIQREVETAYFSILENLHNDPKLQQTDIAVLVTDMAKYRARIQAVFDRPPRPLAYNLIDYAAAQVSTFSQAVLGMMDLALESFTRSRVFDVLVNPCCLARLGADRAQALLWLNWADQLGIFHGWDKTEKQERGYPASGRFGWRLGLQRLRLGQYMDTDTPDDRPAQRFGDVLPYADLHSNDRAMLDPFSSAVEELLPFLNRLRKMEGAGKHWAELLRQLVQRFLDVPADRPEEAQVRDRLLAALEQLVTWDHLHPKPPTPLRGRGEGTPGALTLPLVREFVRANLEGLDGGLGRYLTGGVTISALQPMRPIPFSVVYILGMGEELFPGSNHLSFLDLRHHDRRLGDIRPAEQNRFLFLEALLAARRKLYVLFNNRDLQKDQELLPAVPLLQLVRYLNERVLPQGEEFEIVKAPLHWHGSQTLDLLKKSTAHDVLRWCSLSERLMALETATKEGRVAPASIFQWSELNELYQSKKVDFALPKPGPLASSETPTASTRELRYYLENPALAALSRHLRLIDEEDDGAALEQDEEPFVSSSKTVTRISQQVMQAFLRDGVRNSVTQALARWPERFEQIYTDESLRCQTPEGEYGDIDRQGLFRELEERINDSLAEFLRNRSADTFAGPVLLGESWTPVGARRRFPALTLPIGGEGSSRPGEPIQPNARVTGSWGLVWRDAECFEMLVLTNSKSWDNGALTYHFFEPLFFYLALLANDAPGTDGVSSRQWLEGLPLFLYLSFKGTGIEKFRYEISPNEAVEYLRHLVADFLDTRLFDLLPFAVIQKDKPPRWAKSDPVLTDAYTKETTDILQTNGDFQKRLQSRIEDALNHDWNTYWWTPLLELTNPKVPGDALHKVHRRFRLLYRGIEEGLRKRR
ncbi:MAG: exodeoxyribonuclease V subunit gamma [Gemmataceae bacterium]|nr:exodeoxyribonuclease V subunit gamma [Gemmataceae bacterium]MCI0737826.1 exodeoxyribonuclease V subunit gamma [Gemmataceae bacterium]